MRYGLPHDDTIGVLSAAPAMKPQLRSLASANAHQIVSSASQLLHDSLEGLQKLHISQASHVARKQDDSVRPLFNQISSQVTADLAHLDNEFTSSLQSQELELQKFIQRLKAEEEERRKKEQEELKRKKEEEKQRQKEAAEAAAKKKAAEEEQKRKDEEAKKAKDLKDKQELEKKKLAEKKAKEEAEKKNRGFTNWTEVEKQMLSYQKDIKDIKTSIVGELDKNKDLKKNVNQVKRKINVKMGQLSNSMNQVRTVANEITQLINQTASHPLAHKWLLNFVAKAIVAQSETEVPVMTSAALPLAMLSITLLQTFEDLEYFLCARFAKKCCFTIGYTGAIDTEEGRIRMGWKRSDGKWENEVKYEERVGGIFSVWSVMSRMNITQKFPFFSMESQWKVLARILNTDQSLLTDVHYFLVSNWWEASCQSFISTYKSQGYKIIALFTSEWAAFGKQKSFPAATRLEVLGEDLRNNQTFNSLKSMEA